MKQCFRWAQAMLIAGLCGGATWAACPSYATAERFQISADGTEVTDLQTGLTWARCSEGQSWSGGTCTGDPSFLSHENALSTAKQRSGWRLPSVKELSALADRGCVNPAIDRTAFPNTPNKLYWSSTPYVVGADTSSWSVNFVSGNVGFSMRYDNLAVRLVKTTP